MYKIALLALLWAFSCVSCASPTEGGGVMLMARRNIMGGGAKMPTAKDYVRDGLVGLWDGIENAGWGVHDSNATSWVDLTGKYPNTTSISKTGWTDNAKVCGGNNDLYLLGRNGGDRYEFCFKITSKYKYNNYLRLGRYGTSYFDDEHIYFGFLTGGFDFAIELNKVYTFGDDYGNRPYMGGVRITRNTSIVKPSYSGETDAQRFLFNNQGFLYCVRRYNRSLTDDEISHNYAIDKARFGLP